MENIDSSLAQKTSHPWQDRGSIGFFKALGGSIKYVLLKPGEFFDRLVISASIKEPFWFYFILSSCTGIISVAIAMLFKPPAGGLLAFIFASLFIFLFIPVIMFITAGVLHLGVMLLGGKGGFRGTFNVLAYSASTNIFLTIPFIGGAINGIWGAILGVKGFKRVHNLTTIKAIIAYFSVFFIVAAIALLAAIAIPNLLKAHTAANDAAAKANVRTICTAIESYAKANNGKYPVFEFNLVGGNTPYLLQAYNNKVINGYKYSLKLDPGSYEVAIRPKSCGVTGTKVITAQTGGVMQEETCYSDKSKKIIE